MKPTTTIDPDALDRSRAMTRHPYEVAVAVASEAMARLSSAQQRDVCRTVARRLFGESVDLGGDYGPLDRVEAQRLLCPCPARACVCGYGRAIHDETRGEHCDGYRAGECVCARLPR